MVTEVSDIDLRQNLTDLLTRVEDRNETILISKGGKPVAALVDADLYARINRMRERFDHVAGLIAEDFAETPAEVGLAEIDAVVAAHRAHECV